MTGKPIATSFEHVFLALGSAVLVIASLALAQKILIPLTLAVLFAFVLSPLVQEVQRRGVPRTWAAILVVLATLVFIGITAWCVTAQVHALISELPRYQATIAEKFASLRADNVIANFLKMIDDISDTTRRGASASGTAQQPGTPPMPVRIVDFPFLPVAQVVAVPVVEGVASTLFVCVSVLFILVLREDLRNRLIRLIGRTSISSTTKALDDAAGRISRLLLMQSVINVLFAGAFTLGLGLIGVPYALLWGLLAGCLRFVPYLGIWLGVLMPLSYCIAIFPGWYEPMLILALCIALEVVVANFLEPIMLGRSTGIAPFALLVAAAFWAWLWGPIGLVLSAPLTTCLVVLGKHVPHMEFLNVALGDNRALDTSVTFYQRLLARDQDEAVDLVEDYLRDHPREAVYDEVLLPALLMANSDRERSALAEDDEAYILRSINDLLDDMRLSRSDVETPGSAESSAAAERAGSVVLGCPARDQADEVALRMLRNLLEPAGCRFEVLSCKVLSAEVVARVERQTLSLVCIASLPPGGLARARYLWKGLRARAPGAKIIVGRWVQNADIENVRQRLLSEGADYVGFSLLETRQQVLAMMPVLTSANGPEPPAGNGRRANARNGRSRISK